MSNVAKMFYMLKDMPLKNFGNTDAINNRIVRAYSDFKGLIDEYSHK